LNDQELIRNNLYQQVLSNVILIKSSSQEGCRAATEQADSTTRECDEI